MKTVQQNLQTTQTLFAIPLSEAIHDIRHYKKVMTEHLGVPSKGILKAFTIEAKELMEAVGVTDACPVYPKVRVYLGMKSGDKAYDMRLFITPVNSKGEDVILHENQETQEGESYVYDFIVPCPNSCDPTSPLFSA
jgi:hypothetical protein